MLGLNQLFRQFGLVVIVNQRKRGDNHLIGFNVVFDKMVAHEIPNGFRPTSVAFLSDNLIESFKEFLFK